jgi:catechol 2,3-dioxygenase-like lactoylglutathione lyase family enzyme
MKRVTLCKVFVHDQDEALDFYIEKLGFEVAEDNNLGNYRWLLVRLPDNKEFCLNLDIPTNEEQKALVGRQLPTRRCSASRPMTVWATTRR